jgi:hypothetical protein
MLGALVLPAAIFAVGTLLLGSYTGGMGKFYQSFIQDLIAGLPRTWSLVIGPYVLIMLLRLVFMRRRLHQGEEESAPQVRREPPPEQVRTTTRVAQARRPVPPPASPRQSSPTPPARPGSKRIEPRISLD